MAIKPTKFFNKIFQNELRKRGIFVNQKEVDLIKASFAQSISESAKKVLEENKNDKRIIIMIAKIGSLVITKRTIKNKIVVLSSTINLFFKISKNIKKKIKIDLEDHGVVSQLD